MVCAWSLRNAGAGVGTARKEERRVWVGECGWLGSGDGKGKEREVSKV